MRRVALPLCAVRLPAARPQTFRIPKIEPVVTVNWAETAARAVAGDANGNGCDELTEVATANEVNSWSNQNQSSDKNLSEN